MRKFPAFAALILGLSLTVAACGSDDGHDTSTSTTKHNDADVAFATDMIQHHAQALAMVDLTLNRKLDPEVKDLAENIRDAQAPEIDTMADWLTEWNEPVPATVRDHVNAEDHGGHDMNDGEDTGTGKPGMMATEDMTALKEASDAEFQDMWLKMMIEHHKGAVQMAQTEEADGQYKPAIDLVKDIQKSQQAEIDTMQGLLS